MKLDAFFFIWPAGFTSARPVPHSGCYSTAQIGEEFGSFLSDKGKPRPPPPLFLLIVIFHPSPGPLDTAKYTASVSDSLLGSGGHVLESPP